MTLTERLSEYLARAANTPLPEEVRMKARLHLLDTLAAGLSGSCLPPGERARAFGGAVGGTGRSLIWGSTVRVDPVTAAMVNGMSAHADETDDSHAPSLSHPGCAVIPAAVAAAEHYDASGQTLLRAIAAGYDIGPRVVLAFGRERFGLPSTGPSSHAYAGLFGAAAATAVVVGLPARQIGYVLSYAAQLCSGVTTWVRDREHVEKAFVFGGMPARNAMFATLAVAAGFDGVSDVFDGTPNFFDATGGRYEANNLVDGLGTRFELMRTNIKKYAVGSPAQAAVQAVEAILESHPITPDDVESIEIRLPADECGIVDDRSMPDINVQYLVAGTLVDSRFTFAMAHAPERMDEPGIGRLRERTTLVPDEQSSGTRSATVVVRLSDGSTVDKHVPHVRGTADDPMTPDEVYDKSADLVRPVVGDVRAKHLVEFVQDIESYESISGVSLLAGGDGR